MRTFFPRECTAGLNSSITWHDVVILGVWGEHCQRHLLWIQKGREVICGALTTLAVKGQVKAKEGRAGSWLMSFSWTYKTIFLERTKKGRRQLDLHWNCSKSNTGETNSLRYGTACIMGFPECVDISWAKLNWMLACVFFVGRIGGRTGMCLSCLFCLGQNTPADGQC